jgi:hypothetical protein
VTADDLMRLIGRYAEACDDLSAVLFGQTAAEADAKRGKATFLHEQILTEVRRLHAEAGEVRRLRASERALADTLHDEMVKGRRLRKLGGARPGERLTAMAERIVAENAQLRAELAAVADEREQCARTIDAMWNEYKASHPSYRTDYQEGYLDALDAAEQRIRGPNARGNAPDTVRTD